MLNIKEKIKKLSKAVKTKIALKNTFKGIIIHISKKAAFHIKEKPLINSALSFIKLLEKVEKTPIQFSKSNQRALQIINIQSYIECANNVLKDLETLTSAKAASVYLNMKRESVALQYRLEKVNAGFDSSFFDKTQYDKLFQKAKDWKEKQIVFDEKSITSAENEILKNVCHYPEFVKVAIEDTRLLEDFLNWSFRDGNKIDLFIQYPALQRKIVASGLAARIGKVDHDLIKIQLLHNRQDPEDILEKVVTLKIEGKEVNILNENNLHIFRGNWALTIEEIFKHFADKIYRFTSLEISKEGIINWSPNKWGFWNEQIKDFELVDLNNKDWIKELPLFEKISLKDARKKFGTHLDGNQWNVAITATRKYQNLDFEETHAFFHLLIPDSHGRYLVYAFGKYAQTFPQNMLHALWNIGKTTDACVAYPDENIFYNHRQHASYSFAITEKEGNQFLDLIKLGQQRSRDDNFVYQLSSENCARWAYGLLQKILPNIQIANFFDMYFLDSEPHGGMYAIFCVLKTFSRKWQVLITTRLFHLFGASSGRWVVENGKRVWMALNHHSFWQDMHVFHPGRLHEMQSMGLIGRFAAMGVTYTLKYVKIAASWLKVKLIEAKDRILGLADKINNIIINNNNLKIQSVDFLDVRETAIIRRTA